jgi:hypothetical protein
MTAPPRLEPLPAAVQEAMDNKIRLPDDVVEALPDVHRQFVRSYMRLIAPVVVIAPGASSSPKTKKVYKP